MIGRGEWAVYQQVKKEEASHSKPAPEGVVAHVDGLRVPDHRLANVPSALLCSTVIRLDWVGWRSRLRRPIPFVLGFPMVPFAVVLSS